MWQMLRVYGVGGKLLKAVQSIYVHCINLYMDDVVREMNARVFGKELELLSVNSGKFEMNQL